MIQNGMHLLWDYALHLLEAHMRIAYLVQLKGTAGSS